MCPLGPAATGCDSGRCHGVKGAINNKEAGFAAAWVVAVLLIVGVVVGAMLQLSTISLRAAVREQESLQALINAESGIAYALTWFESEHFDFSQLSDGEVVLYDEPRELGDGGIERLVVRHRAGSEFEIHSTGYRLRQSGGKTTRTVVTAVKASTIIGGGMFPRHWVDMKALNAKPGDPNYDPSYEGFVYEMPDVSWTHPGPIQVPNYSPPVLCNGDRRFQDCNRWAGNYSVGAEGSPTTVNGAQVRIEGNVRYGGNSNYTVNDSVLAVNGAVEFGGSSKGHARFENSSLYAAGKINFAGSSRVSFHGPTYIATNHTGSSGFEIGGDTRVDFHGPTTLRVAGNLNFSSGGQLATFHKPAKIYVDGNLTISGAAMPYFAEGAEFFVLGDVTITGSGWPKGTEGEDAPWIVFRVGGGLSVTGGAGAGADMPNAVFLVDPDKTHPPVAISGSGVVYGGIYAPTRTVDITGSGDVYGSIVADEINIPTSWRYEWEFKERYERVADRLMSFWRDHQIDDVRLVERMMEWREVR